MSVLPKFGAQSCCGAGRVPGVPSTSDCRYASIAGQSAAFRESFQVGGSVPKPAPQADCPASFGNSDIRGGSFPTP